MRLFGFGKKEEIADRYAGKPLLKLVDSFVLKSINELDPSQEALLVEMTPKLQQTFSKNGTWEEVIIQELQFPDNIKDIINTMWQNNQNIAKEKNIELTPLQFAQMFVDTNIKI
jgi:hypothetical protein